MLKFKTSCAVLANLSSNLLNEVGLSLFRYFEVGLRVCDIVVNKFTFAISSPDEFLSAYPFAGSVGKGHTKLRIRSEIPKFMGAVSHSKCRLYSLKFERCISFCT